MLNNRVTDTGVLVFKGGRAYVEGWELAEPGMCREHAIFACLYVARFLDLITDRDWWMDEAGKRLDDCKSLIYL